MEPVSAMAGLQIAGSIVSAGGSIMQGYSNAASSKYNAAVAMQGATAARQAAAVRADAIRRRTARVNSEVVARSAASNMDPSGGSTLEVLQANAAEGEWEALSELYNGEVQARRYESQAKLDKARGADALLGGYLGAGASLLQGGFGAAKNFGPYGDYGPKNSTVSGAPTRRPWGE